jgi:hypothetical protein
LSLTLTSCGGSGKEDFPADTEKDGTFDINNISVTKVKASSSVLKAGHEGLISVSLKSEEPEDARNVSVSIIFMKNDETEVQYYSGTYIVPVVKPGTHDYELKINIPKIVGDFGNYQIIACLYEKLINQYPAGANPTDEEFEGDIADDGDILTTGEVDLDPSLQNNLDLKVIESHIDEDVMILTSNSLSAGDLANLSIQLKLMAMAQDVSDGKVKFYITHLSGDPSYEIQVKNSAGSAVDETELPLIVKYQEVAKGYDLVVPDSVVQSLVLYVKNEIDEKFPFVIRTVVSSASESAEFADNNEAGSNFWLVPDESIITPITNGKKIGFGFDRFFGNSYLGAGVKLFSYTGIDKDKIYSENGFYLPAKLLSFKFNFFEASLNARGYFKGASTDGKTPGLSMLVRRADIQFPGKLGVETIYSYYNPAYAEWKTEGMKDGKDILNALSYDPPANGVIEFDPFDDAPQGNTDYSFSKSYEYTARAMVGPIPVSFTIGVIGTAGVGAFIVYEQVNLAAGLIPYSVLNCYGEGGVGIPGASVGLGGDVDLVKLQMNNFIWTSWNDYKDGSNVWYKQATLNEYSGLELDLVSGGLYAWAEYPWPKFKKKWGCTIFVGFEIKEAKYYLWRSDWCYTRHVPILPKMEYVLNIPIDDPN